jgi:predicted nuclease of predicted toxin-antitoxin system
MKLWIDAQLSPTLAPWINKNFDGVEAVALRDIGLRDAEDKEIFESARQAGAVVMSKDSDFVELLSRRGPPPQLIWITCGNTSNARMRTVLSDALKIAIDLLNSGEGLVEISGSK